MSRLHHPDAGFTLLEMMGVIVAMGLVLGIATDFYIDLSRASNRASRNTSEIRRATAILDHIARDLESTMLIVKAPEVDPLDHPWLFVAESQNNREGSDHLKFVTRNHQARRSASHESDLAVVAYSLEPSEFDDSFDLFRWSSPQLPESLDRSFPDPDDEATFLLAEGIADFGLTFTDESGESVEAWDSTTLVQSGTLPTWVEISVAMYDPEREESFDFDEGQRRYYSRRVRLPVRPLDLVAMIETQTSVNPSADSDGDGIPDDIDTDSPENGGSNELGDDSKNANLTVGDCLDLAGLTRSIQQTMPAFSGYVQSNLTQPWSTVAGNLPADVRPFILPHCR